MLKEQASTRRCYLNEEYGGSFPFQKLFVEASPLIRLSQLEEHYRTNNTVYMKCDSQIPVGTKLRKLEFMNFQENEQLYTFSWDNSNLFRAIDYVGERINQLNKNVFFSSFNKKTPATQKCDFRHSEVVSIHSLHSLIFKMGAFFLNSKLRRRRHRFVQPGFSFSGVLGWVNGYLELFEQLEEKNIKPDYIVLAMGNSSIIGAMLAKCITNNPTKLVGVKSSLGILCNKPFLKWAYYYSARKLRNNCKNLPKLPMPEYDFVSKYYDIKQADMRRISDLLYSKERVVLDHCFTPRLFLGAEDVIKNNKNRVIVIWNSYSPNIPYQVR